MMSQPQMPQAQDPNALAQMMNSGADAQGVIPETLGTPGGQGTYNLGEIV